MQELSIQEIDFVSGGQQGFFETIGWIADNPFTAAGIAVDRLIDAVNGPPLPPPPNLGFH